MVKEMTKKAMRWTPRLVKQLRGNRSVAAFEALIGAPKNIVSHWEAGRARPDAMYSERLSEVAEREHFLKDWKLVGSMTLVGDLENAEPEIAELFRRSVEHTASQTAE